MISDRKGLSEVVTAVLLITVTLTAGLIIFAYVKEVVHPLNLSPEKCIDLQISPPVRIISSCYDSATGDMIARIDRTNSDYEIKELLFIISSVTDGKSISWSCDNSLTCGTCKVLDFGTSKNYYFFVSEEFSTSDDIDDIKVSVDGCLIDSKKISAC